MTNDFLKNYQKFFLANVQSNQMEKDFEKSVLPAGTLTVKGAIEVYHNDYFARMSETLGESFEGVWAVLGDEDFFKLCRRYISLTPSMYKDLGSYGKGFPEFLDASENAASFPFLKDLAEFEQAFWRLFHSQNVNSSLELSGIDERALMEKVFHLGDNFKVFSWSWRVLDIWNFRDKGFENCEEDFEKPQNVFMYKANSAISTVEISSSQLKVLNEMNQKKNLGKILEEVEIEPEELSSLFFLLAKAKVLN